MKFIFTILLSMGALAQSQTLVIHNPDAAKQVLYTSAEYNEALPKWMVNGLVQSRVETQMLVKIQKQTACTLWAMNFSNDKSLTKNDLAAQIFSASSLNLWKRVSGKVIFTDVTGDFALSYNCVRLLDSGELIEVDAISDTEFNHIFKNILEIKQGN